MLIHVTHPCYFEQYDINTHSLHLNFSFNPGPFLFLNRFHVSMHVSIIIGTCLDRRLPGKFIAYIPNISIRARSMRMVLLGFGSVLFEHSQDSLAHWVVNDCIHFSSAVGRFLEVDLQEVLQVVLIHHSRDSCQQHGLIAGGVTRL